MMDHGGFSLSNLLTGHTLAVLAIFLGAVVLLGLLHVSFKGAVVV